MRIKVTKNLTYPEARKLYEQKPEFSFSKVVKSLAAKPESKTTSIHYSIEDTKITESRKVIMSKKPNRNTSSQNQNSTSNKPSSEQTNVHTKQNQPSTNSKPTITSNRVQKGSEDLIKQHNRFGTLTDDEDMNTGENLRSQGARFSRSRSPIKAPK